MLFMAGSYDFRTIEHKWQSRWERDSLYRAPNESDKPKYYALEMLPSGSPMARWPSGRNVNGSGMRLSYSSVAPVIWR